MTGTAFFGHFSRRALLAGLAALAAGGQARGQGLRALRVGSAPDEAIVTPLWAERSGLFRRNGIDLEIESQHSGSAVASAVLGGTYGLGKSSLVALIAAHAHNVPFVLVAPGGIYDAAHPNTALLIKSGAPIRNAADLAGKTIAVSSLNDLYDISIRAWIAAHGGDASSSKFVELPSDAIPAALASGRIDAAGMGTPQLEEALDAGTTLVLGYPFDAIASRFLFSVWFSTRQFVDDNRSLVTAFAQTMRTAAGYVNGHQPQTVDLIAQFTGIEPRVIAKMQRAVMGTALDADLVQPVIDRCAAYNLIPATFDAKDFIVNIPNA